MRRLSQSLRQRRGATATETVILIVLIAMVVLAGIKAFQGTLGGKVEFANAEVAAVSTEGSDSQRRRANAKRAKEREAASGGNSSGSSQTQASAQDGSDNGGSSGLADPDAPEQGDAAAGAAAAQPEGGCGGFNPFAIPIGLGLLGLLGYVIMKSQKG
jgi:Flp pilus assembly pilin Flp